MHVTAFAFTSLAVIFFAGCQHRSSFKSKDTPPVVAPDETVSPSPRLIVGRVIAVDSERGFAFVDLNRDAPAAALVADAELSTRTPELQETALLLVSRHRRGRTLGATITSGKPSSGDEVVWLAP
jgi:hypothetical protein